MSSRDARRLADQTRTPDDLDRLLRGAVREQIGMATPPDHVWQRIEHQLRGGPSPVRRRPSSRARRTAPLVQALALASFLVVLGLSLGPALQWPYLHERDEYTDILTPTPVLEQVESGPLSDEEGLLSGRETLLLTGEQADEHQVTVRDTFPDEVSLTSEEGLLSKREILLLAGELARGTSPGMDPIPKHWHEWRMLDVVP